MIELYTWMTPNGQKVSIMLEEVGLAYRVHPINIEKGAQFDPDFPQDRAQQQDPGHCRHG